MYISAFLASRRPRRAALGLGALLAALLLAACGDAGEPATWQPGAGGGDTGAPVATAGPKPTAAASGGGGAISLSATGDIIMGNAPSRLPANGGKGFFASVTAALKADVVMGNLEEPLTVDTGTGKCGANSTRCFQFRAPPEYAAHLRDAGFDVLNQANNHGYDYGPKGYENTQKALKQYDLKHTGAPDEYTVVEVKGVKVAVVGFSSYVWSNSLVDIAKAKTVVAKAATMADLVVVQVHMGGEERTRPGSSRAPSSSWARTGAIRSSSRTR
ncbi:hypothetical protein GCM10027614_52480 [Micromonospora vulcania]